LYEELLIGDDPAPTFHPRIMKARETFLPWEQLTVKLEELTAHLNAGNLPAVQAWLAETISGYQAAPLVDWIWSCRRQF
ncbi:MAG: polysaccharide biosynthesis protein, partial [Zoogloeaceae bacterium]|nr:polysaccharide biosynthesis protein [Zoogloeaceae bacterium]